MLLIYSSWVMPLTHNRTFTDPARPPSRQVEIDETPQNDTTNTQTDKLFDSSSMILVRDTPRPSERRQLEAKLKKVSGSATSTVRKVELNLTSSEKSAADCSSEQSSETCRLNASKPGFGSGIELDRTWVGQAIVETLKFDDNIGADKPKLASNKSGLRPPQKSYKPSTRTSSIRAPSGIKPPSSHICKGTSTGIRTSTDKHTNSDKTSTFSNIPRLTTALKKYHFFIFPAS